MKVLQNPFDNMALKNLNVIPKLQTYFSIGHKIRNKWVAPTKIVEHFLCIDLAKYTRASLLARKMSLFSSNLNMQNSVVMFTFSDFDRQYHFWVNLLQKIKIVSLFWNLMPEIIWICRIQWRCYIFLVFIGVTLFGKIWSN